MTSPDEIRGRRFLVALRGYDRDEVSAYLDEVAGTLESLRSQVEGLEAQLEQARRSGQAGEVDTTAAIQSLGEETTRILVTARESAQNIEAAATAAARETESEADRRAREIVDRANAQAARTIAEAERRRDAIAREIRALEEHRDGFVANLGQAMATLTSAVGGLEPEGPPPDQAGDADQADADQADADQADADQSDADPSSDEESASSAEEGTAADQEAAGEPPPDEPAGQVSDDEVPAEGDSVESDQPAVDTVESRRDAAIDQVRDDMARTCKRGLQDVQNEVMAAIREHGRRAELDDLLPDPSALESLGDRGVDGLSAVYVAALVDAAIEVGGEPPEDLAGGARVNAAVATFRAVLAHEVTSSLRATLRAGLEAEEPEPQLSERVGEVFRDLRGPVLEGVVDEHLHRTYSHGLLDAWEQLGVEEVRWRAGQEARCPENRCRTNASEGSVAVGADFPSGDRVPPAHPGCTCVIVPLT